MTKKELEIEAEEYAKKNGSCFSKEYGIRYRTYMDCAEPREKRIEELEKDKQYFSDSLDKQIEVTLKLDKENAELKAQIEKMKCCQNCRKFNNLSYDCTCAEVCNEWELRG